uniref:Uncharacterized protein n=1 Tax=Brassica campestris TaxID=3711 RepID=M4DT41_BRACM
MLPIQDKNDQLRSSRLISQLGRLKLLWTLYVMRAPFFTMYTRIPSIMGLSLLLVPISTVDRCFSTNGTIIKVDRFEVGQCTMYTRLRTILLLSVSSPPPRCPRTKFYVDTTIPAIETFTERLYHWIRRIESEVSTIVSERGYIVKRAQQIEVLIKTSCSWRLLEPLWMELSWK